MFNNAVATVKICEKRPKTSIELTKKKMVYEDAPYPRKMPGRVGSGLGCEGGGGEVVLGEGGRAPGTLPTQSLPLPSPSLLSRLIY